ncbi:hypothetical protein LTR40_012890, partial [Exophiala xenobiotica]
SASLSLHSFQGYRTTSKKGERSTGYSPRKRLISQRSVLHHTTLLTRESNPSSCWNSSRIRRATYLQYRRAHACSVLAWSAVSCRPSFPVSVSLLVHIMWSLTSWST